MKSWLGDEILKTAAKISQVSQQLGGETEAGKPTNIDHVLDIKNENDEKRAQILDEVEKWTAERKEQYENVETELFKQLQAAENAKTAQTDYSVPTLSYHVNDYDSRLESAKTNLDKLTRFIHRRTCHASKRSDKAFEAQKLGPVDEIPENVAQEEEEEEEELEEIKVMKKREIHIKDVLEQMGNELAQKQKCLDEIKEKIKVEEGHTKTIKAQIESAEKAKQRELEIAAQEKASFLTRILDLSKKPPPLPCELEQYEEEDLEEVKQKSVLSFKSTIDVDIKPISHFYDFSEFAHRGVIPADLKPTIFGLLPSELAALKEAVEAAEAEEEARRLKELEKQKNIQERKERRVRHRRRNDDGEYEYFYDDESDLINEDDKVFDSNGNAISNKTVNVEMNQKTSHNQARISQKRNGSSDKSDISKENENITKNTTSINQYHSPVTQKGSSNSKTISNNHNQFTNKRSTQATISSNKPAYSSQRNLFGLPSELHKELEHNIVPPPKKPMGKVHLVLKDGKDFVVFKADHLKKRGGVSPIRKAQFRLMQLVDELEEKMREERKRIRERTAAKPKPPPIKINTVAFALGDCGFGFGPKEPQTERMRAPRKTALSWNVPSFRAPQLPPKLRYPYMRAPPRRYYPPYRPKALIKPNIVTPRFMI